MNIIPEPTPIPMMDVAGPPLAFTMLMVVFALLLLAGFVAVVTLVILAIVKNRPGLAALAGGLVLVGLVGMLLMAGLAYFSVAPHATEVHTDWHHGPAGLRVPIAGEARFNGPTVTTVNWGVSLPVLLLVIAGVAALAVLAVRRLTSARTTGERRIGWLAALALLAATILLLGFVGVRTQSRPAVALAPPPPKAVPEMVQHLDQRAAALNQEVERWVAEINSQPIESLEQRFTAPKIPLPPEASPEVPTSDEADSENAATAEGDAASNDADARGDAESADVPPAEAADAAKELAAGIAAFVKAMSQVFDEYTRIASGDAGAPTEPIAPARATPPAKPRPEWVDDPPKRVGNVWRHVIVTDLFATKEECDREADRLLLRATFDHIHVLVGKSEYGSRPGVVPATIVTQRGRVLSDEHQSTATYLARMGVTIDYVRREIAKDEYLETVERTFGPMKRQYTLVEFSPAVDRDLRERWNAYQQRARVWTVGMGAGAVLGLLVMIWGLLKIDTLTKGYYSKRLFLGVPAAIIGGVSLFRLIVGS